MKYLLIVFTFIFFTSCKEDRNQSANPNKVSELKSEKSEIEIFNFPDTVPINTMIKGGLKYNRNFGNVDDSKIKERYIFFHVGTDQNSENISLKQFDKFQYRLAFEDTIGDGLIKFQTVFTEPGNNFLHGVVKDMYKIENSDRRDDSSEVSIKETIITKNVFVLEE